MHFLGIPEPLESRIAPALGAFVSLSELASPQGFYLTGEAGGHSLGAVVSGAGDMNGDGFRDFIVSDPYFDGPTAASGAVYVIFGAPGVTGGGFDLSALDGRNGFRIDGNQEGSSLGLHVSAAGDINGDGFDDVVIGDPHYRNGDCSGIAYVILGHTGSFAPSPVQEPMFSSGEGAALSRTSSSRTCLAMLDFELPDSPAVTAASVMNYTTSVSLGRSTLMATDSMM